MEIRAARQFMRSQTPILAIGLVRMLPRLDSNQQPFG